MKPYPDAYMSGRCKDPEVFFFKDIPEGLGHAHPGANLYKPMCARTVDITLFLRIYETPSMYIDHSISITKANSTILIDLCYIKYVL